MNAENSLQAVLIDLDGTIVDSLPGIFEIYLDFLKGYGHQGTKEQFAALNGPSLQEVMVFLKEHFGIDVTVDLLVEEYRNQTAKVYQQASLFPGVVEFLEFAQKKGLKLALVTAAPRPSVNSFFAKHHLEKYFSLVVTGDEVEKAKPDPSIYLKALDLLQLSPNSVLTLEDSSNGVKASLGANIPTFLITHGKAGAEKPTDKVTQVKGWKELSCIVEERLSYD